MSKGRAPVITLTTDFGLSDSYVAQMKGVILSVNPGAVIVDITHLIPPFDVRAAASVLNSCYGYFPPFTVHVAVVDPGVGTLRRPIAIAAGGCFFVGPDNGIFTSVLKRYAGEARAYHLTNTRYFAGSVTATFHGRDVFAPIAARLSLGFDTDSPTEPPGVPIDDCLVLEDGAPVVEGGVIKGVVTTVDHFGNCITNISGITVSGISGGKIKAHRKAPGGIGGLVVRVHSMDNPVEIPFTTCYGESDTRVLSALINGSGFVELFVKEGSAAVTFGLRTGDSVYVYPK
ncbi:MAG: SAM-dependent chlorinase/fluorinase [Nitrospirae bacterium]|nr:SAM-dependent chlorinase/fluorinase [Nitrospirota bacterium]